MAPLFSYYYHLTDFSYWTTVLLELWFGWFLLFHYRFIAILICLVSSIPPLLCCYYELVDFFYCTTVLWRLWFGWIFLLHDYFMAVTIWLIFCIPPPFNWKYDLADFFYSNTVLLLPTPSFCRKTISLLLKFDWFLVFRHRLHCYMPD